MSCWEAYSVCLRLLSPLHVGWRRIGNLQQTRYYLPARNLWGALTSRLARQHGAVTQEDYDQFGQEIGENLRFTYFYPTECTGKEKESWSEDMLWPWDDEEKFSWLFLSSRASTAAGDKNTAVEGSLHDVEYISPFTRQNRPVTLVGVIFERSGFRLNWQAALRLGLQVGGERSYGWGKVRAEVLGKVSKVDWFGLRASFESHDTPIIQCNNKLLAHTHASSVDECSGAIERIVTRSTRDGSSGRNIRVLNPCWMPGSRLVKPKHLGIRPSGLWYPL